MSEQPTFLRLEAEIRDHLRHVSEAYDTLMLDPRRGDVEAERALLLDLAAQVEAALEDDVPVSVIFVSRLAGRLRREAGELGLKLLA